MKKTHNSLKKVYIRLFRTHSLASFISKEIKKEWKIVDIGCGRSSVLRQMYTGSYKVGLDFYKPYILQIKKESIHDLYIIGDARMLPFKTNYFDCVIATEILEHMDKKDGLKMIKECERVAKKKIIMTTPNGFLPTYSGPNDNPNETHVCGYNLDELKKLGFRVFGFNGLKVLWKVENGQAVFRFKLFRSIAPFFIYLTEFFVYNNPSKAFQFFFVKDIKNNNQENDEYI